LIKWSLVNGKPERSVAEEEKLESLAEMIDKRKNAAGN